MNKTYKVKVIVHDVVKNKCPEGFIVGDSWIVGDGKTPGGMCAIAYNTLFPTIRAFRFGAEYPWDADKDVTYMQCPDRKVGLIYEIRKMR